MTPACLGWGGIQPGRTGGPWDAGKVSNAIPLNLTAQRALAHTRPPSCSSTVVCKQFSRAFSLSQQLLPAASISLSVRIKLGARVHQHCLLWQRCQGTQGAPWPLPHSATGAVVAAGPGRCSDTSTVAKTGRECGQLQISASFLEPLNHWPAARFVIC